MAAPVDVPVDAIVEARAHNEALAAMLVGSPPPEDTDVALVRRLRSEGGAGFPPPVRVAAAEDRVVAGPAGPLRTRWFVPATVRGAYLHVHGGGWFNGAADEQDTLLWSLACGASVAVVSVDHRLAPEHPHPAAVDDIEHVVRWFLDDAPAVAAAGPIVLGGESSGAHLCLAAALRLGGVVSRLAALDLCVGIYDLGLTPSARAWGERNLLLSTPIIEWFVETFTPGVAATDRRDVSVSPLHAGDEALQRLPRVLVTAAALDPLLDDSVLLAERLRRLGVDADLRVWPEATHGFFLTDTALGRLGVASRIDFVRSVVEAW